MINDKVYLLQHYLLLQRCKRSSPKRIKHKFSKLIAQWKNAIMISITGKIQSFRVFITRGLIWETTNWKSLLISYQREENMTIEYNFNLKNT
jgi:hypothetical protein